MVLIINKHAGWTELTLNRPDRLNSFNTELHLALFQALSEASEDNSVRAILITASGRGFCAGQDLSDRDPSLGEHDLSQTLSDYYNPLVRLIRGMNKPVVCAVNGVAAGAGANLAFGCDVVLAADQAKFIQSFSKVGLIPDAGGTWLLPRLIGEMRAKALAFSAEPLSAEKAQEWGLVWSVHPAAELAQAARDYTQSLAQGATFGLGLTKQAIQSGHDQSLDAQLDLEAEYQGAAGRSLDYKEGVAAFIAKRKPEFMGQ